MACGATKVIAGGATVTCDNPGTSTHTGLHAGGTKKFWMNLGYTVRVSWSTPDLSPARQKPIIRGDYGEVSPIASYRDDFNDLPDNSGMGPMWQATIGTMRALSPGILIPGNLGSNVGTTNFVSLYQGGNLFGRFKTDDVSVMAQLASTSRSLATNMRASLLLRCNDVWDLGTRVELNMTTGSGSVITLYTGSTATQQASGASVPITGIVEFRVVGDLYEGYLNGASTPFISWNDTTKLSARGDTQRRWGVATQANYPMFQRQFDSPGFDWLETTDVAA